MLLNKLLFNVSILFLFVLVQICLVMTSLPQSYRTFGLFFLVISVVSLTYRARLDFIGLWSRLPLGNKCQHFLIAIIIGLFSPWGDLSILGRCFIFLSMFAFNISTMSIERRKNSENSMESE